MAEWRYALTDLEVSAALVLYLERERGVKIQIEGESWIGLTMHRDGGRYCVEFYSIPKPPPKPPRKPFRWFWQSRDDHGSVADLNSAAPRNPIEQEPIQPSPTLPHREGSDR